MSKEGFLTVFAGRKDAEIEELEHSISLLQIMRDSTDRTKPYGQEQPKQDLQQEIEKLKSHLDCVKKCRDLLRALPLFPSPVIGCGSLIVLRHCQTGERRSYLIVPRHDRCCVQADRNKMCCLSIEAPAGKALLGKKVGDMAVTHVCDRTHQYEVLSVI